MTDIPSRRSALARKRLWRDSAQAYLYLTPALLIVGGFHFLPIFYAFYISLHKWEILQERFIGLENYTRLARDPEFGQSLLVTLYYVIGTVPLGLAVSLGVALLLFRGLKGTGFYRTVYFLPNITSVVAAAVVWSWIFNPQQYGVLNYLFSLFGSSPQQWLLESNGIFKLLFMKLGLPLPGWAGGPSLALVCIVVMSVWSSLGFNMIVFLAGLGSIPKEFQEAARIDGAGEWGVFWKVTFPLLSPTTFFLVIISTIRAFQAFNQIFVMTGGGPLGTTRTITVYIFKTFYESTRVGYGAAIAFALFAIILLLTLVQFKAIGERVHYG
ncbi:MAG: sugar ABC transporter permease [Armatimonadetes bacterium]|nr:sugar ABC transporter permease [Armatimonadota bacterium]